MRALVGKHMGGDFSNSTQWVVDAVHEAFQRGFSLGLQHAPKDSPDVDAEVVARRIRDQSRAEKKSIELVMLERDRKGDDDVIDV